MIGPVEKAWVRVKKKSVRLQIIEALGGKCMWPGGCTMGENCGSVTDPDMLHVEHIYNDGARERQAMGRTSGAPTYVGVISIVNQQVYYGYILEHLDSGRYQILCANHNAKKQAIERCCKRKENRGIVPCPCAA